ncbi:hypothetical protein ACGFX2_06860 [Streptomyces goshikiensis]|uniref:hypothetical protein n=1 Tax=Streptomyces goshikiensis TaxID=1942 RepID=UPI00371B4AB9
MEATRNEFAQQGMPGGGVGAPVMVSLPRPSPGAPDDRPRRQRYPQKRRNTTGPLRGTVISDMNVLISRHAERGHE